MKRLLLISLLAIGCGPWTKVTEPVDPPSPPAVHDARTQADEYLAKLADAFDAAGDSYENHEPSTDICEKLGDAQRDARLAAFTPLMEELNRTRPKSSASDAEREAADHVSAALLHKWAEQIRGLK